MTPRPGAAPAAIAAQALALRARPSRRQPRHALRPGDQATSTTSTTDARVGPLQAIALGPVQAIVFTRPRETFRWCELAWGAERPSRASPFRSRTQVKAPWRPRAPRWPRCEAG